MWSELPIVVRVICISIGAILGVVYIAIHISGDFKAKDLPGRLRARVVQRKDNSSGYSVYFRAWWMIPFVWKCYDYSISRDNALTKASHVEDLNASI